VLQQQLLNAQQSLEQDYWRLRQLETRYRLIFDMAADAVLVIDEPTNKVLEANPVAKKLLASDTNRIIGKSFPIGFEKSSTENVSSLLAETRVTGKSSASNLRLSISDRDYKISISLLRQDSESRFLVRLYQTHGQITSSDGPLSRLIEITNNAPDGVVITNTEGHIQYANKAFLNLAQLASEEHALNQSMDRWLGRTGVDLNILITNLRNYNSVKLYASKVRGEHGTIANVEISACMVDEIDPTLFVIFIRDIERRVSENITKSVQVPRSVNEITSQVGKLPLKEIVRESSDMIEKGCIKTALELTDDNRASAAEILGLSRQSLYAKLKTHNIGDLNTPTE
jgi:transcriptional regulator PpsR